MKKRILFFSDCYIYGGSERNIINLMNFLAEKDEFEIYFCYRQYKEYQLGVNRDLSKKVTNSPIKLLSNDTIFHQYQLQKKRTVFQKCIILVLIVLKKFHLYSMYNSLKICHVFNQIKPDIIHINNGGYPASALCQNVALLSSLFSKNVIYHINNPAQIRLGKIKKLIDKKVNKNVKHFITASRIALESLEKRCSFSRDKFIQIYNTVEDHQFRISRTELLSSFGIGNDKFIITEVAFLSERKGQIFLLKALVKIKNEFPTIYQNIYTFLVGDGEDYEKLKVFSIENNINDHVIFTMYVPNFYDYINACNVFVLPSIRGEDMPLVILSAMSMQKCIISTNVAGIVEEIENGTSGVLLNVEKLDNLSNEIIKLFNDRNLLEVYSQNAKIRFNNYFSKEIIYNKFEKLYQHIVQ